ncbi:hypothetical protein LY71_12451 [Geodermatophilus tzadiensis]|uniref:Uncharacterized protein n=1 Tax=Geodermatophilus tzadiensis TaxID=1137988 RepID=A0A2T0SUU6_9ACTN|nr:hypothetical protein LY71_12451 [Geodermatophilus tzadiensis]
MMPSSLVRAMSGVTGCRRLTTPVTQCATTARPQRCLSPRRGAAHCQRRAPNSSCCRRIGSRSGPRGRLTPDDGRRPAVAGGARRRHADRDGSAGGVRRCGVSAPRHNVLPAGAVELCESRLSLGQVGARLGMSQTAVKHRLRVAGVRLRSPSSQAPPMCRLAEQLEESILAAERHLHLAGLQAVALGPAPVPSRQHVAPERAAVAFTAARGWNMTKAPRAGSATCSPSSTDRHGPAPTCPGAAAPWVRAPRREPVYVELGNSGTAARGRGAPAFDLDGRLSWAKKDPAHKGPGE